MPKTKLFISTTIAAGLLMVGSAMAQPPKGPDTDGDGTVTREEVLTDTRARFEASDADGDGYVTREEAAAQRKAQMSERKDRRGEGRRGDGGGRGEAGWDRLDRDGDARLSQQEMEESATERFDRADANGDGAITRDEMRAQMEARRAMRDQRQDPPSDE